MAIPATDTAAYPARPLIGAVDLLVVMLYDQHWRTSPPGPIAAPAWATRALALRVGEVGAAKLIAAFPTYGYRWVRDSATVIISYDEAMRSAHEAYVPLLRDPASSTLHAESPRWAEWVSDAVLLDTLVRGAQALRVSKFALWRLGLEDPRVWTLIAQP
jgi:spore germination protein YaaH